MKRFLALVSIAAMCTGSALAEPPATPPKPTTPPTPTHATPSTPRKPQAMTPTDGKPMNGAPTNGAPMMDPAAMQAKMEAAAKPGPMHKWLESFDGAWDSTVKELDFTTGKWNETKGQARNQMTLGGRFLETSFDGQCHGKPMLGFGTMGYNNTEKRFESSWYSNACSALCFMTGNVDSSQRVLTLACDGTCPVTGEKMNMREVVTLNGKDSYTQEFFMNMNGAETKMLEIINTRSKTAPKTDMRPANR